MDINNSETKRKFGVIGNPISHSLSPYMQNAAFKHYNLDCSYERILIPSEKDLELFLLKAKRSYTGLNVTLPYKGSVIKYLDSIEESARLASSVNVISIDSSGSLNGFSTDGYGMEMALRLNFNSEPQKEKYLFLGCGGAANSCIVHLLCRGARDIAIANRTLSKADELIKHLHNTFPEAKLSAFSLYDINSMKKLLKNNYLLIQSTSLGLKDEDELPLQEELITYNLRIFDMIYKDTRFQKYAREKGCRCIGGIDMLLYQGTKAFEIWTGLKAPVEIMKKALLEKRISIL
ncbi:MAG TPA: shikimate dehydrogenase [Lentisphaeria bacterium]|nr:MAG: shikimate dehydrogenase [Lentisphaerae bacterium GWF2_38_69]HBM16740.1 shikimate dehydrogenase [Lentisphaeria bacterium]